MADVRSFYVEDLTGAPLTSASPTWAAYVQAQTGVSRTPPAVPVHRGGGVWAWTPSDADELAGTVAVVDFGTSAEPRRVTFAVHLPSAANQFWCVHVEDDAGALWAGAAPTIGVYDSNGAPRTPPSVVALVGAWLYSWTPTSADVAAQVDGVLLGPAGSNVPAWSFSSAPEVDTVGITPPAAPGDNPARAVATWLAGLGPLALETPPGGTQALTFGTSGNVTAGPLRAAEGLVGEFHIAVLNSGGLLAPYMGGSTSVYVANVSVTVRSRIDSYSQGEAVARATLRRLHLAALPAYVACVCRDAEPIYQGLDENGHHRFAFGLDVTRER
jgi:hypothetical protein